jgi:hypothetical protein
LGEGYNQACSSFSLYRQFMRDLIHKKKGDSYETDAEFYDGNGGIWLHVEVKKSEEGISAVATSIEACGSLQDLPDKFAKELEYVLDVSPRYLWLVGPGSIDPPAYVYQVKVSGLSASLRKMDRLPSPPHGMNWPERSRPSCPARLAQIR